ncbi:MAG: hypothetical protein R2838_01785 [Caldilineaceae bacterium]
MAEVTEALAHVLTARGQWISGQEMWRHAYENAHSPRAAAPRRTLPGRIGGDLPWPSATLRRCHLVDTLLADRGGATAPSALLTFSLHLRADPAIGRHDPCATAVHNDGHHVDVAGVALNDDALRRAFLTRAPTNVALRRALTPALMADTDARRASRASADSHTVRSDSSTK